MGKPNKVLTLTFRAIHQVSNHLLSFVREELIYSPNNARQIKLGLYKSIIDFYHQETNDRMFKKRWEELHDPELVEIGLEKRLESGIKGKDSANAYVPLSKAITMIQSL
jgi:hypothetical protein